MDKFNLNVYVEQVNHETDSTTVDKWEENEELALNNVIDPNTEFKTTVQNETSVTPSNSYDLVSKSKDLDGRKLVTEPQQQLQHNNLTRVLIQQRQSDCLSRELEETLEGFRNRQNRSISDSSLVPKVHAYCLMTQEKNAPKKIDNSFFIMLDTKTSAKVEPHDRLLKYPKDRITVVTEKYSYPTKSPDADYRGRVMSCKDSYLSTASSYESVATASIASVHRNSKSSLISTHNLSNMANESGFRRDSSMTTADQLAWELRRARDRFDTASNISGCSSRFELDSNYSERAETMSTISDVSEYEEEMFRIKRLLLLDTATPTPPSVKCEKNKDQNLVPVVCRTDILTAKEDVDMQIQRLTVQLQNAIEEKEKYRIEALAAETKIALEWQEKYQEALRQKAHVEGRLETVQTEMSALVSGQNEVLDLARTLEEEMMLRAAADSKAALQEMEKLVLEIHRMQQVVREADGRIQDLTVQLELRNSEVSQWKAEVQSAEGANEKLRIEFQELKIEAESKDGSIQGLKSKLSDQHVEIQSLLQAKLKAESNLTSLKNEIETAKKSGCWYRDQLHVCQAAKVKVQQELITSQESIMSRSHQIEKLKGEIANLRQVVEKTQHRAVREKEALMRKLEVIQADMLEREATIFSQIYNESSTDTINTVTAKLKGLEEEKLKMLSLSDAVVQELKEEITSLKNELKTKETASEASETENAQLMMRVSVLQKALNEKDLAVQLLENKNKSIEMSHSHLRESLKLKEQTLLELKYGKVAVEVALAAAVRERTEVDVAISKLKNDFAHINTSYQMMKAELREKEKHITNLKADMNVLHREKLSQTEKINELEKTEEAFRELRSRISQTEALEQQVEQVSQVNKELSLKINQLSEAYGYAREQISEKDETIAAQEEELVTQTRNFEARIEEVKAKEQSLVELQNEKTAADEHVLKLQVRIHELEALNQKLADDTASVQKQLSSANSVIKQLELLSRESEEEKNLLEKQMKILKEPEAAEMTPTVAVNVVGTVNFKCPSPELLPTLQKSLSSDELGCIQIDLHHLYELIQNAEAKLSLLLSEGLGTQESIFQQEQGNAILSNNLTEFYALCSVLVNINDSVTKVLGRQNKLLMEIKTEKQSSEPLDLKQGMTAKIVPQDKLNNISYNKQIEIGNTASDDTLNYKEQIDAFQKEIRKLKGSLKMSEIEHHERRRKYESNIRTLLKKVKEHMRGRKVAERALEELHGKTKESIDLVTLKCETSKLQAELEASKQRCEEQKRIADRNQEALLVLEKERGKLAQSCSISKEKLPAVPETSYAAISNEFDQKTRELRFLQSQDRVAELEEEVRKSHIINKELRREIFSEKCETSQLRKQVASLRMGLETANDMLDTKKVELGRTESMCCLLQTNVSHLKKQLETEQQAHEDCKQEVEKLRENLEETRAKDPVLADQIKTLSYHLNQKSQETSGLQEKIRLSEERWLSTENGLQQSISGLRDELVVLRAELDSVRSDKFTFQTQAADLRAALHSSVEQNKILRLKLETFDCENNDRLPDLTSSLPLPPLKYDETQILELLHQSTVLPHNKPLSNLQCCLDSLKQEMATLQRQLAAKTSARDQMYNKTEYSLVKNV